MLIAFVIAIVALVVALIGRRMVDETGNYENIWGAMAYGGLAVSVAAFAACGLIAISGMPF
jgi:hypothetical protein